MLNYMQKTVFTLLIILSISSFIWCQTIEWENNYGGSGLEETADMLQTDNGQYLLAGVSYSYNDSVIGNYGGGDFWVTRVNESGQMLWQQNYGGTDLDKARSIIPTTDGYIIGGISGSTDHDISNPIGEIDYWLVEITEEGVIQWEKSLGRAFNDFFADVISSPDGGYLVGGHSERTDAVPGETFGDIDILIYKTSSTGEIEWEKSYDRSPHDRLEKILTTLDGGYLLGGSSLNIATGEHYNIWLIKIDQFGEVEWEKTYGGSGSEVLSDLVTATNEGYFIGAVKNNGDIVMDGSLGYQDYWLIKIDETGNIIWEKKYGHEFFDMLETIVPTNEGGVLLGGTSDGGSSFDSMDYWIVKVDENGDMQWQKNYGYQLADRFSHVIQTNDGGFLIGGTATISQEYFEIDTDFLVYKICDDSNNDCNVIDAVDDEVENSNLIQVYPNPTKDILNLEITTDLTVHSIKLLDIQGKTLLELDKNTTQFSMKNYANGMYIITIDTNKGLLSRKINITKS